MRRFVWRFLRKVWLGLVLAVAVAWLLDFTTAGGIIEAVRFPLAAVVVLCTIGKALYDTLFYDHYWP